MKKHRLPGWLAIGLWVACLGLTGLLLDWWFTPVPVALRAYPLLRPGMTSGEVNSAIGVPPGYYASYLPRGGTTSGPFGRLVKQTGLPEDQLWHPGSGEPRAARLDVWNWDRYWIWVAYDGRGVVVGSYLLEVTDDTYPHGQPGIVERLVRAWVGL